MKWAGGKSKLADWLVDRMPLDIRTYVEPFCGGAAVFFRLAGDERRSFDNAILADKNEHLIACYRAIQTDVERLITRLAELAAAYEKRDERARSALFYHWRDEVRPRTDIERGVRLLFLNKTCFNGLWRENSAGRNNVPFGRYANPKILDRSALRGASRALQKADLRECNYRDAIKGLGPRDFVYFDPPYAPASKTANFTSYAKDGFTVHDQQKLRDVLVALGKKNVRAMLSNARTADTDAWYRDLPWREVVSMARSINSNASKRGNVDEVVVFNWIPELASKPVS